MNKNKTPLEIARETVKTMFRGRKVYLSLSGGVDSTTVYSFLSSEGMDIQPVLFKYPSKHNHMEAKAAARVSAHFQKLGGRPLLLIDATSLFAFTSSSLLDTGGKIPDEDYSMENIKKTVVPGRNTIFIAALASMAESDFAEKTYVALGMHHDDNAVYPDCRPEYIESITKTILLSTEKKVLVIAPILHLTR